MDLGVARPLEVEAGGSPVAGTGAGGRSEGVAIRGAGVTLRREGVASRRSAGVAAEWEGWRTGRASPLPNR